MLSAENARLLNGKVGTGEVLSLINKAISKHLGKEVSGCFALKVSNFSSSPNQFSKFR